MTETRRGSQILVRQVVLGAVVFAAVLILLFGLTTVAGSQGASQTLPTTEGDGGPVAASTSPQAGLPSASPASPTPTPDPVLVGAGDIGDCNESSDEATAALLDGIEGTVFTAGDNAYPSGRAKDFAGCYDQGWGRHRARTRPAAGNHDWHTADLGGYREYFGAAAAGPDGESWYSYDLGSWHVIVLDSNCEKVDGCGAQSPQGEWLVDDLAASVAKCTVAIWHHPRFTSGVHGNARGMDFFWRALYDANAELVINGHDHDYERFAPQDPDGQEDRVRGMRQFVVGTGGTHLRPFEDTVRNSELRAVTHGVLALTLHSTGYEWQFHPAGGDLRDRGTGSCH